MNTGQKVIEWLRREQLRVDDEWCVEIAQGIQWWASQNLQEIVVVGSEVSPDGDEASYVRVTTDCCNGVELTESVLNSLNLIMSVSSMAGPVYDATSGTIRLSSLCRVHEGIRDWLSALISLSSILQIHDAHHNGHQLASILKGEQATSEHPESGLRTDPDELVHSLVPLIASNGKERCQWHPVEFKDVVQNYANRFPSKRATYDSGGATIEFPYGDFTSLCQISCGEPHPRHGNGLFILQRFPADYSDEFEGIRAALDLNHEFLTQKPAGYGFGSFCYDRGDICFNGFIPNLGYRRGLLPNFYFACAERARAISYKILGDDWS